LDGARLVRRAFVVFERSQNIEDALEGRASRGDVAVFEVGDGGQGAARFAGELGLRKPCLPATSAECI
jgi:hypothetical protein